MLTGTSIHFLIGVHCDGEEASFIDRHIVQLSGLGFDLSRRVM